MSNLITDTLKKSYARRLVPDPAGGYVGTIHEFPGLIADGDTADEAMAKLDEAAASWLEAAEESGYNVAEPANYEECSGKIALRISRRLHKLAAERASLEAVSLNQLIGLAISAYLGQIDGVRVVSSRYEEKIDKALRHAFSSMSNQFMRHAEPVLYQTNTRGHLYSYDLHGNNAFHGNFQPPELPSHEISKELLPIEISYQPR
jgi:antitoxin HicB